MRPTVRCERRQACAGFTLIEAVLVITLTGVLASVVSVFIVPPVQAYLATAARVELVDQADLALRRMGRDLRLALPNSTRVTASGLSLELIPTSAGGRYATEGAGRLDFAGTATSFSVLGPPLQLAAGQSLVFYNLGSGVVGSDAYAASTSAAEQASSNRRRATSTGSVSTVTMDSSAALPPAAFAPPYRVLVVTDPVTYRCDLAAGTLTRYSAYGFQAAQPDPPSSGTSALLASGVTACRFSADATLVAARAALVSLSLTLSSNTGNGTESASLHHASYVDNLP